MWLGGVRATRHNRCGVTRQRGGNVSRSEHCAALPCRAVLQALENPDVAAVPLCLPLVKMTSLLRDRLGAVHLPPGPGSFCAGLLVGAVALA